MGDSLKKREDKGMSEKKVARIGIYERGMWIHKNNLNDIEVLEERRRHMDADAQGEARLYGLGPLTFIEEIATMDGTLLGPNYFSILRRYKGAILNPPLFKGQEWIPETKTKAIAGSALRDASKPATANRRKRS